MTYDQQLLTTERDYAARFIRLQQLHLRQERRLLLERDRALYRIRAAAAVSAASQPNKDRRS